MEKMGNRVSHYSPKESRQWEENSAESDRDEDYEAENKVDDLPVSCDTECEVT